MIAPASLTPSSCTAKRPRQSTATSRVPLLRAGRKLPLTEKGEPLIEPAETLGRLDRFVITAGETLRQPGGILVNSTETCIGPGQAPVRLGKPPIRRKKTCVRSNETLFRLKATMAKLHRALVKW
jgi:hypothetical protein